MERFSVIFTLFLSEIKIGVLPVSVNVTLFRDDCQGALGEISHGWEILPRDGAYMEIENIIRYAPRAVGLKPSAMQGEARLRGL